MAKFPKLKFGKAFPDQFQQVKYKHIPNHKKKTQSFNDLLSFSETNEEENSLISPWRALSVVSILIIIFAIFFTRLFHLQIAEGKSNRELADSNRIQVKIIHAPRGVIYDRNGKILAQNEPSFRLVEKTETGQTKVTKVSRDDALKMEVVGDPRLKQLEIDSIRSYPYADKTAHVLGYVGEINEEELESPQYQNYKPGDSVGRGGIEQSYEKVLRGVDGGEIIEVDAAGKTLRTLTKTEAIPGQNIYLSLDLDLQQTVFQKLAEQIQKVGSCCGSAIAQDPHSGEILALVSYPSYNPKDLGPALLDPNSPMLNRAIGGNYPPGSTYKIISSLAGLSTGKITPQTQFEDTGVLNLGPFSYSNWYFSQYGKTEGAVDMVKALQRSNDIYYYRLGQLVSEKEIGDMSKVFGLGKKLGIDIPGEIEGLVPDDQWKQDTFDQVWYPGDTLHMAIGQGFVLTTPLQISNLISAIASNGKQFPPHLAKKITDSKGNVIKEYKYDGSITNKLKQSDIEVIKKGLELVPKFGGTAWPFFTFPVETAGKTGTAEFGDPKNKTHAWYTSYAPANNPQISLTVMIEAGGEGSSVTGAVSKEIYRWYFSQDKNNLIKDITNVATDSARTLGE